jgi:hypothetical protein
MGNFWRNIDWKMLIYLMVIWNTLRIFGIFYDHSVHFVFKGIVHFIPVLVWCTKRNLAALAQNTTMQTISNQFVFHSSGVWEQTIALGAANSESRANTFTRIQGDRMSLGKKSPKLSPKRFFCQNCYITITVVKSSTKISAKLKLGIDIKHPTQKKLWITKQWQGHYGVSLRSAPLLLMGIGSQHKTKGQFWLWLHRGPQHGIRGTARLQQKNQDIC